MNTDSYTHHLPLTVQIFDTDCYGVMWHGAYHRWLELARGQFFEELDCPLSALSQLELPLVFPVAKQELTYHAPAKLWDTLDIQTRIERQGVRIVFHQTVVDTQTQTTLVTAQTTCAIMAETDTGWRPARKLPDMFSAALERAIQPQVCAG